MKKKTKILYIGAIILNVILCGVDICTGNYIGAVACGLSAVWLGVCYSLVGCIYEQDKFIEVLLGAIYKDGDKG